MIVGRERTKLVEVSNIARLIYGGTETIREDKPNFSKDDTDEDLDISFPDEEMDKSDLIDDEFQPSASRFIVALLIVLSSALNCFIQYTFVTIW